jgi:hydroxymethylpyrimidine/phosphomethylpyrimidine kinase
MGRREEEADVKERLELAVEILVEGITPALLPAAGANIGFALVGARVPGDVAAIRGGIVADGGMVRSPDATAFGADAGVARVILTAMRADPLIRGAAVIRFSPAVLAVLGDLLLETCGFDRAREPPGLSTMDWGVASCCQDGVPDAIFDRGAPGKEGLVRILGEEPVAVAKQVLQVSNGLDA